MARVKIDNLYKTYQSSSPTLSLPNVGVGIVAETDNNQGKIPPSHSSSPVLKGINLDIQEGEFMVLVGPSGCGKSTLLRLIAGLEDISAGKILIGDRIVNDLPPKERDIAMVFQNYALYPHLKVYDNIAFGLRRMNGIDSSPWQEKLFTLLTAFLPPRWRYLSEKEKKIQAQVEEVAKMLQIEHLLYRLPKQLSGGQKQRVALGRAIARNPQVFLMDEPLSNLDAKLRTETRISIVRLQQALKVTTIYVTHDQTEAMTMGDRIAVMNQGEIQQIDTPREIYRQPANVFVAQFIGSPPMNLLEVNYEKPNIISYGDFFLEIFSEQIEILKHYNYDKIILGIRPESFKIMAKSNSTLPVKVNLVEALGHETILTVNLQDNKETNLQIKIFNQDTIKVGEILHLTIDLTQVNFFDIYQGKNVKLM